MAVTDYKVIRASLVHLGSAVAEAIADGWQPLGAPALVKDTLYQAMIKGTVDGGGGGGGPVTITINDISDATEVGKDVLGAENGAAARQAIGAGTSNLELGTGATQAMPGNTSIPPAATWESLDKPEVIAAGATQAAARQAIGAGTSDLELGTGAGQAMPGNTNIPPAATWESLDKPAVIAAGATQAAARQAIGAGTSNLELGSAAGQAMPGDREITIVDVTGLEARLQAIESQLPVEP